MIIEAALLTDDEKVTACTLAKAAAADYVKTSTGLRPRRRHRGRRGADAPRRGRGDGREGRRRRADLEGLKAMVAAGATRIGASAGVRIVQESKGGAKASPGAGSGY